MKNEHSPDDSEHGQEWPKEVEIIDETELNDFDWALIESLGPNISITIDEEGRTIFTIEESSEDSTGQ